MFKMLSAVAVAAGVMMAGPAFATTIQFNPTADGDVQTFGGDDVDTTDTVLSVTQSGGLDRRTIFEFNLAAIPDTVTINSASLKVTLTRFISQVGGGNAEVDLFAYAGDGTVNIGDYSAAGTQVYDANTPSAGTGAGDMLTFAFTSVAPVQSVLGGNLLTIRFETDSFAGIQLASLENTTYGAAELEVDYTDNTNIIPLPGALVFALTGLAGLSAMARRKRA